MKKNLNVNKNLLKARVFEKGLNMTDFAEKLGISSNLLAHKLMRNCFSTSEILSINELLNLSVDDFSKIFFEGRLALFEPK